MGVDLTTYRHRVGIFRGARQRREQPHKSLTNVMIPRSVSGLVSDEMNIIGALIFIAILLFLAGIEQNPGPMNKVPAQPESVIELFKDPDRLYWFKSCLVLKYLKNGLENPLTVWVENLQLAILHNIYLPADIALSDKNCICNNNMAKKGIWTCSFHHVCTLVCSGLEQQFIRGSSSASGNSGVTLHCSNRKKARGSNLVYDNSDVSAWTDTERSWEIAKLYMTAGYTAMHSAVDTDCSGLLSLIIRCKEISNKFSPSIQGTQNVFEQVREIRHRIMHSPELRLPKQVLDELIAAVKVILNDPALASEQSSQDAIEAIKEVELIDYMVPPNDVHTIYQDHVKDLLKCQTVLEEDTKRCQKDIDHLITLTTDLHNKLEKVDEGSKSQINELMNSINSSEERINKLQCLLNDHEQEMKQLNQSFQSIRTIHIAPDQACHLKDNIDGMDGKMDATQQAIQDNRSKMDASTSLSLRTLRDKVSALEERISRTTDHHRYILNTWKDEDRRYVSTKAATVISEHLTNRSCVTVAGHSGSGKSVIAHHVALQFREQGYDVLPVESAMEIKRLGMKDKKQIFVIDDPVGIQELDKVKLGKYESCQDYFVNTLLHSSDIKVVFTCRKKVVNEQGFTVMNTILKSSVIDISTQELQLSEDEKMKLLEAYSPKCTSILSKLEIMEILRQPHDRFPLICRLFGNETLHLDNKSDYFRKNIFRILAEEIARMREFEPDKYCALVLCMIYDNRFDQDKLNPFSRPDKHTVKLEAIREACGGCNVHAVSKALTCLAGIYLIKEGSIFRFIHDTYYEAVAYDFGQQYPKIVIEHCTSTFMRERVRMASCDRKYFLAIPPELYPDIAVRLVTDIEAGHFYDVFLNQLIYDELISTEMCNHLRTLSNEKIRDLFFNTEQDSKDLHYFLNDCPDKTFVTNTNKHHLLMFKEVRAIHWVLAYNSSKLFEYVESVFSFFETVRIEDMLPNYDNFGLIPIACLGGNKDVVERLVKKGRVGNIIKDVWKAFGDRGIHLATNLDVTKLCLSYNVNINVLTTISGQTALNIAAGCGELEIVQFLTEKGADLNKQTKVSFTSPLMNVLFRLIFLDTLVENGALTLPSSDKELRNEIKTTARERELVKYLIEHGADVNLANIDDETPLHVAARYGETDIIRLLVKHKARVDVTDCNGRSALWLAARYSRQSSAECLIENGANSNLYSKDGVTPLLNAVQSKNVDMVKLLVENGAGVNILNNENCSPLRAATDLNLRDIMDFLMEHDATF